MCIVHIRDRFFKRVDTSESDASCEGKTLLVRARRRSTKTGKKLPIFFLTGIFVGLLGISFGRLVLLLDTCVH